jgi:hypothetical protein
MCCALLLKRCACSHIYHSMHQHIECARSCLVHLRSVRFTCWHATCTDRFTHSPPPLPNRHYRRRRRRCHHHLYTPPSQASYLGGLLRERVDRELGLSSRHGLTLLPRKHWSFTPTIAGPSLLLGPPDVTRDAIARLCLAVPFPHVSNSAHA